jgi:hypothetical protein
MLYDYSKILFNKANEKEIMKWLTQNIIGGRIEIDYENLKIAHVGTHHRILVKCIDGGVLFNKTNFDDSEKLVYDFGLFLVAMERKRKIKELL